jgi:hypothetical protein
VKNLRRGLHHELEQVAGEEAPALPVMVAQAEQVHVPGRGEDHRQQVADGHALQVGWIENYPKISHFQKCHEIFTKFCDISRKFRTAKFVSTLLESDRVSLASSKEMVRWKINFAMDSKFSEILRNLYEIFANFC